MTAYVDRISIHAPLAGCDQQHYVGYITHRAFQSTHPLRGATCISICGAMPHSISIHAPLAGCDQLVPSSRHAVTHFNPRTPCGVRHGGIARVRAPGAISIHAPLAGCDTSTCKRWRSNLHFNPRTPCGVRLRAMRRAADGKSHFNPRTPCGVRLLCAPSVYARVYFNPRTPCGVRLDHVEILPAAVDISIHAPLAGCDSKNVQRKLHFFELADKLSARIAAKKPSAKADRCA